MISRDISGTVFRRLMPAAVTLLVLGATTIGGPATYDPATRSFRLTYTYAALPTYFMSPDQVESLGSLQTATAEQDAKFRSVQQAVSQIIFQVTDGRAKIGSLEYVDSIKKADLVVSLTGVADRGGYSQLGAIEGRPGQVVLYYQNLVGEDADGMIDTVAHELCHYLFALPDEYSNGSECPLANPGGPGCLMDNYFNRHGFLELCRPETHNPRAPFQGTLISPHQPKDSCKFWVDQFFNAHPPGPDPSSTTDPGTAGAGTVLATPAAGAGEPAITRDDPFTGVFRLLVDSAALFVKGELNKVAAASKSSTAAATASAVTAKAKALAEKYLKEQLPQAATAAGFVRPTPDQLKQAVAMIVKRATAGRVTPPPSFNPQVVSQLRTKAQELAVGAGAKRPAGSLLKLLITGQTDDERLKNLQPIIAVVRKGLIAYLTKGLLPGFAPASGSSTRLSADEQKFVDQLARDAVTSASTVSNMTVFQEAALLHIQLSLDANNTINAIASELNLPGAKLRNTELRDLQQQIKTALAHYALPGRPYTGFGSRRTYIVAPRPQDPDNDFVDIDAGDHIPYEDVRNVAVGELSRLLRRERIEFLDEAGPGPAPNVNPGALAGTVRAATVPAKLRDRFADQVGLINKLIDAVRRNRVENIVFLVPPGGLSPELGDVLEDLRNEVVDNPYSDVRIDLILWDLADVPLRTRDLVARTGGIVQSIGDVDEIGMAAQRIENDLVAGSWVTTPEQGTIDLSSNSDDKKRARNALAAKHTVGLDELRDRFIGKGIDAAGVRASPGEDPLNEPFHPDRAAVFEMSIKEIEQLNKRLGLVTQNLIREVGRPEDFSQVGNAISGLAMIRDQIDRLQKGLKALKVGDRGASFHSSLHTLIDDVGKVKLLVRTTAGLDVGALTPLRDTDDYFDWQLRKMLAAEARALRHDLEDLDKEKRISPSAHAERLNKASYFLQRATERDQRLTDLRRNIYSKQFSLFVNQVQPDKMVKDPIKAYRDAVAQWEADADDLERKLGYRSHYQACLLLIAAQDRRQRVDIDPAFKTSIAEQVQKVASLPANAARILREDVKSRKELAGTVMRRLLDLEQVARLLDLASSQPINVRDLKVEADALAKSLAPLGKMLSTVPPPPIEKDGDAPDDLLSQVVDHYALVKGISDDLNHRVKALQDMIAAGTAQEIASCDDNEDRTPPADNALTPLRNSLKFREDFKQALDGLRRDAAKPGKPDGDRGQIDARRWFGVDLDDKHSADLIRIRVDELIYGDFPLLMLDLLGRFRLLESDLRSIDSTLEDPDDVSPAYKRMKSLREMATVTGTDAGSITIRFRKFRVEAGAKVELVLGLSRPLRRFEDFKKSRPKLRLLDKDGSLVEKPYLNFEPDVSTDTMLVWTAPKPDMNVGIIGAGDYIPQITIPTANLPVAGNDNMLDYTFSVGTRRPNVQLITALRQPQPTVAGRDRSKDPEAAYRGTLAADQLDAVVEVQVIAGSSIKQASVTGTFQRFDRTNEPIERPNLKFLDDGVFPDLQKDDGIYTVSVTLLPNTLRKAGEYRIFIQAVSTDDTAFVPIAEPIPVDPEKDDRDKDGKLDPDKDPTKNLPGIPPFQRSSSMNFHVSAES